MLPKLYLSEAPNMSFVQFAVKGYEGNDIVELIFTQKNKND